jgi:hypothetical protein
MTALRALCLTLLCTMTSIGSAMPSAERDVGEFLEHLPASILDYEQARVAAGLGALAADEEKRLIESLLEDETRRHAVAAKSTLRGGRQSQESIEQTLRRLIGAHLGSQGDRAVDALRRRVDAALGTSRAPACARAISDAVKALNDALLTCLNGAANDCAVATVRAILAQLRAERAC